MGGQTYPDYGILNEKENYDPGIRYEPNWWNIVMAVVFFEFFFIPPIYVFGFHLMHPVGPKETKTRAGLGTREEVISPAHP